nr:glycosyltransferase family 2 protein [uncultured Pseudodesulfovibrio sp.]
MHYGRIKTTLRCLAQVFSIAPDAFVVVSNNGSSEEANELAAFAKDHSKRECLLRDAKDESLDWGTFLLARTIIVHNGGNLGFAAGCNVGVRLALQRNDIEHIWLLNNDTQPKAGSIEALLGCAAKHPDAVIGSTVVDMNAAGSNEEARIQVAGGVRYNPLSTRIYPAHEGASLLDLDSLPRPRLDYIYGASLFTSSEIFRKVGLLDESYFLFYEELDFCRRATMLGYGLHWCRESHVLHGVSESVGRPGSASNEQMRIAAFHEARSTILFTRRHHAGLLPFALLARLIVKPLWLVMRGEHQTIGPALRGVWAAFIE